MKISIVLSVLIAASCALPTYKPDPNIVYDLKQFFVCADGEKIFELAYDALNNDPDIRKVAEYLEIEDFRNHIRALDKEPTYLAILTYLEKYGVAAYEDVNEILSHYGLEPIDQLTEIRESQTVGRTVDSLFDEMMTYIDDKCTQQVFDKNLKDDPKFKVLVDHLKSDEFKQIIEAAKTSETVKQTLEALNAKGLNLMKYVEYIKKIYHFDW